MFMWCERNLCRSLMWCLNTEQTVALRPGKTSEVTFVDYVKARIWRF